MQIGEKRKTDENTNDELSVSQNAQINIAMSKVVRSTERKVGQNENGAPCMYMVVPMIS